MPRFQSVEFGKYFLLERIATGGMAEVFKAKIAGEHGFEKIVIIKTLFPHLQSETDLVNSFIEEAKLAALLHHQNIVQIYDFGKVEESYFIAMEYLSGMNLRKILDASDQFPLDIENALFIAQQICAGLNYAHNKKDADNRPLQLIHRDVSPPNMIITDEGQVKIIDFGIARAASQNTSTRMGIIKGKVAYMSPEQAEGTFIDHRSDIFSIGILLYEMITGQQMYKGDTVDVLAMARDARFKAIETVRPDLPEPVLEIIHKALEKDINARYQSSINMMNDIETCITKLNFRPAAHKLAMVVDQIRTAGITEKIETVTGGNKSPVQSVPEKTDPAETFQDTVEIVTSRFSGLKIKMVIYSTVLILFFTVVITLAVVTTNKNPVTSSQTLSENPDTIQTDPLPVPLPRKDIPSEEEKDAMAALDQKQFHDAVMLFETLLALNPSIESKLNPFYIKALLGAASEFLDQDINLAEDITLKLLSIDPENVQGYFQLGQIYVKRNDYENAKKSYQKIIELDHQFVDAFFNLGYIHAMNKDFESAEMMYQKAVDLEPPYLDEALFNLAVVQDRLGRKETVAINLIKALSINPNNKMVEKYLEKFNRQIGKTD